jgi:DNA repair exonuclease SbcCD ATPase subunit
MDNQDEIRASLETLTREASENWRQQLRGLRAALDRQISSIESTLDEVDRNPVIDAALEHVSSAAAERANQARKQVEATAAQAVAAIEVELRSRISSEIATSTTLRTALDEAKKELESAQNRAARAEAAQRATTAQHRETLNDHQDQSRALDAAQAQLLELQVRLKHAQREAESHSASLAASQQQVQELSAERADLVQRVKNSTAAAAAAQAQYRQLESVSQKLSGALSQMLREREPGRTSVAEPPAHATSPQARDTRTAPAKVAAMKSAPAASPSTTASLGHQKKPLQFSEKARDAKRVKIRRGIDVNVDGIPGELVDLSTGGAQVVLRQAVKPNQLVRLLIPTAAGQVICKGRIVWVVFEQPDTSLSVYRSGVKFADADQSAVEDFMNDYREELPIQKRRSPGVA